jgi:predicted Na+-dependent transporter
MVPNPCPCLQGVETRRGEAAKALLSWPAALWVAASSLLLTPLAALTVRALPLADSAPGLALGLAAWYCVPTTLSRSIALTEVLFVRVRYRVLCPKT